MTPALKRPKEISQIPRGIQRLYTSLAKLQWDYVWVLLLFLAECALSSLIIVKVPYTEIDWQAYMEEVDFWLDGEYDYRKIYGGTGPLVYPAGFLYSFGALQWLTQREIPKAQVVFWVFYLLTQGTVLILYTCVLRYVRQQMDKRDKIDKRQTTQSSLAISQNRMGYPKTILLSSPQSSSESKKD